MGFGTFLANAGRGAQGAMEMADSQSRLREQEMHNENLATATRAVQSKEAADREALARLKAQNDATQVSMLAPTGGDSFSYEGSGAPVQNSNNTGSTMPVGMPVAGGLTGTKPVAPRAPSVTYGPAYKKYQDDVAKFNGMRGMATPDPKINQGATVDFITDRNALRDSVASGKQRVADSAKATARIAEIDKALAHVTTEDNVTARLRAERNQLYAANKDWWKRTTPGTAGTAGASDGSDFASIIKFAENSGRNAVSPKGAKSEMQVMPHTGKNPGFGVAPAKDNSMEELERVGRDYANAMMTKYNGNPALAAVAYNWGPGNTDNWIKAGADFNKLPAETQKYIQRIAPYIKGGQVQPQQVQTAQPQNIPPAATPVRGDYRYASASESSPESGQITEMTRQATIAMQTASTPQEYQAASAQLQNLKIADFSNKIIRVGSLAQLGDINALRSLVGQYGASSGAKLGVVPMSDGTVQVVRADENGKAVPVGTPQHPATLASGILKSIVPSLREQQAKLASFRAQEDAKNASAGNKEIAVQNVKDVNHNSTETMKQNAANQRASLEAATKQYVGRIASQGGAKPHTFAVTNEDGYQTGYVLSGGKVMEIVPSKTAGGFTSLPSLRPVGGIPSGAVETTQQYGGGDGVNSPLISGMLNAPSNATAGLDVPYLAQ